MDFIYFCFLHNKKFQVGVFPCCGLETDARSAKTGDLRPDRTTRGSKIMFGGIRRYLARHHPYRRNTRFYGKRETRTAPPTVAGLDVIRYAAWRQSYLDLGGREGAPADHVHSTGVKRLSAFFELPYWQVNRSSLCCFDISQGHWITVADIVHVTAVRVDVCGDISMSLKTSM